MKDFREDFFKLYNKLKNGEHFSFGRFSDGEMIIMQNKYLELTAKSTVLGDVKKGLMYSLHYMKTLPGYLKISEDIRCKVDPILTNNYLPILILKNSFQRTIY